VSLEAQLVSVDVVRVRENLAKIVGRKPTGSVMFVACLAGKYAHMGLIRCVKHRDHTRSWVLTQLGKDLIK